MKNELILLTHIVTIVVSLLIAKRLGQNALIMFIALSMVLANLFVLKQITLFGMTATAADALAIGSMLGLNMLQEFFTRESARHAIIVTFFASGFFAISSLLHLWYTPSAADCMHEHFAPLLAPAPALVFGSMVLYALSQCIDYVIYGLLQTLFRSRFLIARNYIAIGISQLLDTTLFSLFLKYLGLIQAALPIIVVSFAVKFLITLIATPLIAYASRTGKSQ